MGLPPPPALGKEPAGGGVEQSPGEDGGGGKEQADGLVAAEAEALEIAAGLALLLDGDALEFVVHAPPLRPHPCLDRAAGNLAEV